jgi:hypothetical protein
MSGTVIAGAGRLWEAKHSYYCNEGNYYTAESVCSEFKNWKAFLAEFGDSDMDMNLLFRWDWDETDQESGDPTYTGDDYYRNGVLKLFWMGQRKGRYSYSTVEVCRADEPAVIAFLRPRLAHLAALWAPLAMPLPPSPEIES